MEMHDLGMESDNKELFGAGKPMQNPKVEGKRNLKQAALGI